VLWAAAYVSVGCFAAESYRQLSTQLHSAGYLFAGIIAMFFVIVVLVKKGINRAEARHMQREKPHTDEVPGR